MSKQEKNSDALRRGLSELPEYSPPPRVWQSLGGELNDRSSGIDKLRHGLRTLPTYPAPDQLWGRIEAALPPTPYVQRVWDWRVWSASAAAIAIVLIAAFVIGQPVQNEQAGLVTFHEEVIDDRLLARDFSSDDEEALEALLQECYRQPFLCETEEISLLRTQLNELTEAVTELRAVLGDFGDDARMMQKLAKFERQRSQIAREIATKLL